MERLHIRELRESVGLTQEALAEAVGVSRVMVVQWESGCRTPQAKRLPKMAEALNCTIDQLFGRDTAS